MQMNTNRLKADALDLSDSGRSDSSKEEGKLPACPRLASALVMFTIDLTDFQGLKRSLGVPAGCF